MLDEDFGCRYIRLSDSFHKFAHGLRRQKILEGLKQELIPVLGPSLEALKDTEGGRVDWNRCHCVIPGAHRL